WLREHGIEVDFIDYRDHPVEPDSLSDWAARLGGWEKLVNRASMTWRNLPDERKAPATPAHWLALIAEFPALVRRPVLVGPGGALNAGFSEKKYAEIFHAAAH